MTTQEIQKLSEEFEDYLDTLGRFDEAIIDESLCQSLVREFYFAKYSYSNTAAEFELFEYFKTH